MLNLEVGRQSNDVKAMSLKDNEDVTISIVDDVIDTAASKQASGHATAPAKAKRSDSSDKENDENSAAFLHDMAQLDITQLKHNIIVLQKRHKSTVKALEEEIERLQARIIKADSTEDATGDPSTTVLLLKAKLAAAEEQRAADQAALQRLQQMLASTQDNANLANSCLLKKMHAAQKAATTAQEALLASEQQSKTDMASVQQQYQEQCSAIEQQHSRKIDDLNARLAAFARYMPAVGPNVTEAELYDAANAVYSLADASDAAGLLHSSSGQYDAAAGMQLVPFQRQQEPGAMSMATSLQTQAYQQSNLDAQLTAQQQQHDLELAKMHQQYVEQLAQVQQGHVHELAALAAQQARQDQHKPTGMWQQLFGSTAIEPQQLNPIEPNRLHLALVQQQQEAVMAVTEAQQLKYTEQLQAVETQLLTAQQQSAQSMQELQQCQETLSATEALHMQHILSMADLEGQLQSEKEASSAQSQQLLQLQEKLTAADAQSLQDSNDIAALKMQLSSAAESALAQEQTLQQWDSWCAAAEALQAETASSVANLKQQLAGSQQMCADQELQLDQLNSKLADASATFTASIAALESQLAAANQTASSTTALQQQLVSSQQLYAQQAQQLEEQESEFAASDAQNAARVIALETRLSDAHQSAQSQQEVLKKYQGQVEVLQQQLEQSVGVNKAQEAKAADSIAALQQTVSALTTASQQQLSMLEAETARRLTAVKEEAHTQLTALRQQQIEQHSMHVTSLQTQQGSEAQHGVTSGAQHSMAAGAQHSSKLQQMKQKLQQTLQAGKAKQAAKDALIADLQHQLLATSLQVNRLQKQLAEQAQSAAASKAALKRSEGHMTNLQLAISHAHTAYDKLKGACHQQSQLHQKAAGAVVQLKSELQARLKRIQQLQASYDNMIVIANGYRGIVDRLESPASQGRMMAALLEMLLSRTKRPADQVEVSPIEHLQNIIEELEALRAQVYPDVYPLECEDDQSCNSEDDWDI